jgi:hypothetical protein
VIKKDLKDLYNEMAFYTLSHPSPDFIHQHIVDAFTAQSANEKTKWISIYFALIGLYLYVEKGYTGKQVQLEHIRLSNQKKEFLPFVLPKNKGKITIEDVLINEQGIKRDQAIEIWCKSVWEAHASCRSYILKYLEN